MLFFAAISQATPEAVFSSGTSTDSPERDSE